MGKVDSHLIDELDESSVIAIAELKRLFSDINDFVQEGDINIPEGEMRLDIAERRGDGRRAFKHVQQMCNLHAMAFSFSNLIKLLTLVDGYLKMIAIGNTAGIFSIARSLLEFDAFVSYVREQLDRKIRSNPVDYLERGKAFFNVLVRARFGTSNPEYQAILEQRGLSKSLIKPFHVNDCLKNMDEVEEKKWILAHYDMLCDYVHHNFSSYALTKDSLQESKFIMLGKLEMRFPNDVLYFNYKYQSRNQLKFAVNSTAEAAYKNAMGVASSNSQIPPSPFSREEGRRILGESYMGSFFRD